MLHVACTRAADQLVITHARRRGGYARALSPFVVGLDVSSPPPVAPPADVRVALANRGSVVVAGRQARLHTWRERAARAADVLPDQLCTDDALARLARTPPGDAGELSSLTGLGPLTAARVFPAVMAALDDSVADTKR